MTERKLKRILHDKPYLMDGLFVSSRYEAQQMALASTLRIDQVLLSIRQDPDISATTWARVDLALKAKERKDHYRATIKERFGDLYRGVKTHRRKLVVAVAIMIVFAFFTLIPSGRTLAKDAFDYIMNVFGNQIKIEPTGQDPLPPKEFSDAGLHTNDSSEEVFIEDVVLEYESLDAFASEYGLTPVRLISKDFVCISITLTNSEATGFSLVSRYSSADGDIVVKQKWLHDEAMSLSSNSDNWQRIRILEGVELLYIIDEIDRVFDGVALLNDSMLWVTAQPSVDILIELSNLGY